MFLRLKTYITKLLYACLAMPLHLEIRPNNQKNNPVFILDSEKYFNVGLKGFYKICHLSYSDNDLWWLILRGKIKSYPDAKYLRIFQTVGAKENCCWELDLRYFEFCSCLKMAGNNNGDTLRRRQLITFRK